MEEYIDILDAQGIQTGKSCTKDQAHQYGYFHATVHVWFYTNTGEILFQKRAAIKETFPGLWDISVAGHVSAGETLLDAAYREVLEEIGLEINPTNLTKIGITKKVIQHSSTFTDAEFNHIYICKLQEPLENLNKQKEEVDALALVPVTTFEKEITNENLATKYVPHSLKYYKDVIKVISKALNA